MGLPAKFWQTLSPAELEKIFATGELDKALCRRLWHLMDYQGKPPKRARVYVSRPHLERLLDELKSRGVGQA